LGEPFLREFYRSFVASPDALSVVIEASSGEVVGVAVGTTHADGFFRRILIRRWWAFALAAIGFVARHPAQAPRVLRAVAYRGTVAVPTQGALLSSIFASPRAPAGTGRQLLAAFVEEARTAGAKAVYLTTDAEDNDRVNRFYASAGWQLAGTFRTREGRAMNCYQWTDDGEATS
jgi:GNAT superfamily N-acetyltransferase